MKEKILNYNWGELFFPLYSDIININEETTNNEIASNNINLMSDKKELDEVYRQILDNRNDSDDNNLESFVIISKK